MSVTSSSISYLGLDPSPSKTGIVLLSTHLLPIMTLSQPLAGLPHDQRLWYHRDILQQAISDCKDPIIYAAIEGPSLYSVNQADNLGQLRGILKLTLHDCGIPYVQVAPKMLKKFAGSGNASKQYMIKAASDKLGIVTKYDDIADAAWLAQLAKCVHEDTGDTRKQLEVIYGIRKHTKGENYARNHASVHRKGCPSF